MVSPQPGRPESVPAKASQSSPAWVGTDCSHRGFRPPVIAGGSSSIRTELVDSKRYFGVVPMALPGNQSLPALPTSACSWPSYGLFCPTVDKGRRLGVAQFYNDQEQDWGIEGRGAHAFSNLAAVVPRWAAAFRAPKFLPLSRRILVLCCFRGIEIDTFVVCVCLSGLYPLLSDRLSVLNQ
jgi:hypothetical protein